MVHLIIKQRTVFPSVVISVIGGYWDDKVFENLNKALHNIPRPPKTPCGQFERNNKDEWSWTSPDLSLVDRVLLILFDQTEESGWKHLSSVADFSREGHGATTHIFHNPNKVSKVYSD